MLPVFVASGSRYTARMRYQGRITQWDEQGYGFITPNGGGESVFLHIKAFRLHRERPTGDEIVTYELAQDPKGRSRAAAVEFVRTVGKPKSREGAKNPGSWALGMCSLFFAALIAAVLAGKLPIPVLWLYAAASVIAFIAYWIDKRAAREGRWRTQKVPCTCSP